MGYLKWEIGEIREEKVWSLFFHVAHLLGCFYGLPFVGGGRRESRDASLHAVVSALECLVCLYACGVNVCMEQSRGGGLVFGDLPNKVHTLSNARPILQVALLNAG